ncbi:MAG TPA: hypothetical protein ENK02_05900 [Planctomycetes bacterium]|nr:hypothetical protein [Planctomycetota bacterium]
MKKNTSSSDLGRHLPAGFLGLCLLSSLANSQTKPSVGTSPQSDKAIVQKMLETADQVQKEVGDLRGKPFKHGVKKAVRTEKELRAFLKKEIFEEELGHGKLERNQWMLQTVGLLPRDMDLGKTILDVLLNQIGGFYDPKQNSFFMMEKTARMGDFMNRIMIAHELTHALDDQYYGLDPIMKKASKTEDGGFAIGSVVEGSATALMTRWTMKNISSAGREGLMAQMKAEQERSKAFFAAPPYFWTLAAKYVMGMRFLVGGGTMMEFNKKLISMPRGVAERVEQALKNPPKSSEQILHPEKYWDPSKRDLPITIQNEKKVKESILETLGGGSLLGEETLGEILCAILARPQNKKLNPMLMNSARFWTNKASEGWGGDRLFMLKDKAGKKGIVWITLWDSRKDAEEFAEAYKKYHSKAQTFGMADEGRMVILCFGSAKGLEEAILERIAKTAHFVKGNEPVEIF